MIYVKTLEQAERQWVLDLIKKEWDAEFVVAHGTLYHPAVLPGLIAFSDDRKAGLLTYTIEREAIEIVTLNSLLPGIGIGTALIDELKELARNSHCRRIWLITTNDNLNALKFYQKRGFELVAVHRKALDRSRELKPQISLIGADGIPLRDEIEFEMLLDYDYDLRLNTAQISTKSSPDRARGLQS